MRTPAEVGADAIFDRGRSLGIDNFAMGNLGSPVCGDQAMCDEVNAICWKLATTPPTTLADVAAVLRFANEVEDAGHR